MRVPSARPHTSTIIGRSRTDIRNRRDKSGTAETYKLRIFSFSRSDSLYTRKKKRFDSIDMYKYLAIGIRSFDNEHER